MPVVWLWLWLWADAKVISVDALCVYNSRKSNQNQLYAHCERYELNKSMICVHHVLRVSSNYSRALFNWNCARNEPHRNKVNVLLTDVICFQVFTRPLNQRKCSIIWRARETKQPFVEQTLRRGRWMIWKGCCRILFDANTGMNMRR